MATVRYRLDYVFDAVGNLTNRLLTGLQGMSGTLTTRYRYDVMNRLTNVVQLTNGVPAATASYAYDPAGRLHRKTYGNGDFATHAYDLESRLLSLAITNGTTPVERWTYGWNPVGHLLAITNQGTNLCLYAYDAADQLTNAVCFTNGLAGGATNAWHYDEAGNWRNASPTHQWFYNADNELLGRSATGDTNWTITVAGQVEPGPASNKWYNSWAECRGVTAPVNPATGTFTLPNVPLHGGSNELVVTVTDAGTNTWTTNRWVRKDAVEYFLYDGNGNLTNWVSGSTNWVYEWDWADRLVKASSNGVVMLENWYDATGRRIAKRERVGTGLHIRQYVWDGWESVALLLGTSGAVLESWTRGVGLAGDIGTLVAVTHHSGSTPGTYYTHHNHRGDIVLTRRGTTTIGRYDYSAFGNLKSAIGTDVCRFQFSSKERDPATGWSYYGYRYYAPTWQRWPNRDPIEEEGGINLYQFVHNSPLNYVDPDGLQISVSQPGGAAIVLEAEAAAAGYPSYAAMVAAERAAARAAAAAAALASTSFCKKPKDPCKGLRDQLNEHIKKLTDYIGNPDGFDNKGHLKKNPGRRDQIIDGRIKSLQNQIENFKKQLEACEKAKGLK
jgi:RHS repeat-associated protein